LTEIAVVTYSSAVLLHIGVDAPYKFKCFFGIKVFVSGYLQFE